MTAVIANNTIKDLKDFFGTPDRPVTTTEFKDFYISLTEAEKVYFKTTPLN